ncbi:MAG: FtsZ-interacting cell division protein ZipA [Arenicella sp.]|jgi:FtsZ-interacting cell division protein ZipA
MTELTLIFLGIAAVLFGGIVAYSMRQQRSIQKSSKVDYVDPLWTDLEAQKKTDVVATHSSNGVRQAHSEKEPVETSLIEEALAESALIQSELESNASIDTSSSTATRKYSGQLGDSDRAGYRVEPQLTTSAAPDKKSAPEFGPDLDSTVPSAVAKPAPVVAGSAASNSPRVDANSSIVTELVARVKNPEPIEQQELLALFRFHDFNFYRKVHIYGLNQLTDLWRNIEYELPSARFVELGVAIQLADRDGAMSKKELHDFQQMALDFSNKFDAPFEFSMDIDEALAQAQMLDQIGRRYDSMAVLNVIPRTKIGFRMADIESCARDLMMSTDKNGIFVKTKGQKNNLAVLYRLACTDGSGHFGISVGTMAPVHDLVIYMNVPAIVQPDRVFQEMVKDANDLATWLDGKVVDRNGRAMTQRLYSVLMQQISDIVYSMQQDGLTPGDIVSKKLF